MTLTCPCCYEKEISISCRIDEPGTFVCAECNEEFTRETVEEYYAAIAEEKAKWDRIIAWSDKMPTE